MTLINFADNLFDKYLAISSDRGLSDSMDRREFNLYCSLPPEGRRSVSQSWSSAHLPGMLSMSLLQHTWFILWAHRQVSAEAW